MADEKVNVSPEESKTPEAPAPSGPGDPPAPEHTEGPAVPGGDQAAPSHAEPSTPEQSVIPGMGEDAPAPSGKVYLPSQSGVMACSFPHGFPLGRISDVPSGPIQLSNCRQPAQARRKGGGPVPIGVGVESPLILMCILGRSSFSNKLLSLLIVLVF